MLSWFASDFFASSPLMAYPVFGFVVAMTVFATFTLRALFLRREQVQQLANLPLEGDDE